jgi:hypothetical protein
VCCQLRASPGASSFECGIIGFTPLLQWTRLTLFIRTSGDLVIQEWVEKAVNERVVSSIKKELRAIERIVFYYGLIVKGRWQDVKLDRTSAGTRG